MLDSQHLPVDFQHDLSRNLREFLWARGFRHPQEIENFLFPKLQDVPHPDGLLLDLDRAISLLLKARDQNQKILVFGDYDVDGTTSTALLFKTLKDWGWRVDWFIPHRIHEGYGISMEAVNKLKVLKPDFDLLISCDCGISSHEGIEALKDWGKQVIVTDHHECPSDRVRADAILNPKQVSCRYPEKNLAGVGVAFLLILALRRALGAKDYSLHCQLEWVAVGTICDLAELRGANRVLVKAGLQRLKQTSNEGLKALFQVAGVNSNSLKSRDVGFLIGPRLNAAGRVGDPSMGLRLLLSDKSEAAARASGLELENSRRRQIQSENLERAMTEIQRSSRLKTVLYHSDFHLGVVGLVASRLCESYKKPFAVFAPLEDEHALADFSNCSGVVKASLRAPKGFHLAKTLQRIASLHPELLLSYGGHAQAAGVSLMSRHLDDFEKIFELEVAQGPCKELEIERDFVLESVDGLDSLLDWIEPLGQGNEAPRIELRDYRIRQVRVMKEEHLRILGAWKGVSLPLLQFRSPWVKLWANLTNASLHFIGELTQNDWQGRSSLEFLLKDVLECKELGGKSEFRQTSNEISDYSSP
jgi:single-stranded-DNA-specific exonuclease